LVRNKNHGICPWVDSHSPCYGRNSITPMTQPQPKQLKQDLEADNPKMSSIETIILQNIEVQANGIIRNSKGYLIGRLVNSVDFEGEHIKLLNEQSPDMKNKIEKLDIKLDIFLVKDQ